MPVTHDVGFLSGLVWSLLLGLSVGTFFIYLGGKMARIVGLTLKKTLIAAGLIALVHGIVYPLTTSLLGPLSMLLVAVLSFFILKVVLAQTYEKTFLVFIFAVIAEIIMVGSIPALPPLAL